MRLIAQCERRQARAEEDEAAAMIDGNREAEMYGRRIAAQQLWKRRKLTKELDALRALVPAEGARS